LGRDREEAQDRLAQVWKDGLDLREELAKELQQVFVIRLQPESKHGHEQGQKELPIDWH
jgi:hypothetical protein